MGDKSSLVKVSCPDHHQELIKGIWKFFQTKHRVDFDVEWGGIPVKAHQLILDVFLSPETLERKPLFGNVRGRKRRNLDCLLEFMYKGETIVRREEIDNVAKMAKKVGFQMLAAAVESVNLDTEDPSIVPTEPANRDSRAESRSRRTRKPASSRHDQMQTDPPSSDPSNTVGAEAASSVDRTGPDSNNLVEWRGNIEATQPDWQAPSPSKNTPTNTTTANDWDEELAGSSRSDDDDDDDASSTYGDAQKRKTTNTKRRAKTKKPKQTDSKISVAQRSRLYRQNLPLRKCELCEYQTREKRYYGTHMKKYHPGVPVPTCAVCKQVFFDQESLGRHMSKQHSMDNLMVTISVTSGTNSETSIVGLDVAKDASSSNELTELNPIESISDAASGKSCPESKSGLTAAERKKIYLANRPMVKCPHCDYKTAEKRYYAAHMGRKHPEVAVPTCDICHQTFFDEPSLIKHKETPNLMVHSSVYVRPMNMANARLAERRQAERDEKLRGKTERDKWNRANRPSIRCEKCDYTTNDKRYLSNHMITQHPGFEAAKCETCQYAFPDEKSLATHRRKYAGGECGAVHNKCPLCAYETPMKYKMYSHLYARHGVNAKGEPVIRRHMCSECEYCGLLPSHLKRHVLVKHSGLKPYKCPRCAYAANNKTAVTTHLRKFHLKLKPWLCDTCGHRCSSKHDLTRHHRVHSGERPYPCATCGLAFADSYTLNGHIRSKHCDAKPFVCQVCAHAFKRLDNLRCHLKKVHQITEPTEPRKW